MILDHFLLIFLSVSACPTILEGYICHIYDQKLSSQKDKPDLKCLDWASPATTSLQIANCKYCMAYIENSRYYAGCVLPDLTESNVLMGDKFRNMCTSLMANPKESINCFGNPVSVCCCTGTDCFDELRRRFSSGMPSAQATCKVFRQEFDETTGNQKDADRMFLRKTCSLCKSSADGQGLEFSCVVGGQVEQQCGNNTYFVGGSLACNSQGTQCCCRGEECNYELYNYHFLKGQNLTKARLSKTYTEENPSFESNYGPSSFTRCAASNTFFSIMPHLIELFVAKGLVLIVRL